MAAFDRVMQRLIAIVEGTVPAHKSALYNKGFKHQPQGIVDDRPVRDRGFFFELNAGNHVGRLSVGRPNMTMANLDLVVCYSRSVTTEATVAMVSDHRSLCGSLLDQGNYQTLTTGLQVIGETEDASPLPYVVSRFETFQQLRIALPVRFSAEVSA